MKHKCTFREGAQPPKKVEPHSPRPTALVMCAKELRKDAKEDMLKDACESYTQTQVHLGQGLPVARTSGV